jgi:hypothetical protein
MQSTTYKMRSLGLNPLETAPILLTSGVCELTSDLEAVAGVFSKTDLIAALEERHIVYRKSWTKAQLLEALASHAPDFIARAAEREKTVRVKAEFLPDLCTLSSYAHALQEHIKLLCFATSATAT